MTRVRRLREHHRECCQQTVHVVGWSNQRIVHGLSGHYRIMEDQPTIKDRLFSKFDCCPLMLENSRTPNLFRLDGSNDDRSAELL